MRILAAANHITVLNELEKELSDIFPEAEIIKENDALMAGKYAFNNKVDIVFAEADMKRMNGLQLIRFVRHEHPEAKGFLVGSQTDFSEDVTGVLAYPIAKNAVRDVLKSGGQ